MHATMTLQVKILRGGDMEHSYLKTEQKNIWKCNWKLVCNLILLRSIEVFLLMWCNWFKIIKLLLVDLSVWLSIRPSVLMIPRLEPKKEFFWTGIHFHIIFLFLFQKSAMSKVYADIWGRVYFLMQKPDSVLYTF